MASFSIGKIITESEIQSICKRLNIEETSPGFSELIKNQIIEDTKSAIVNNKVPGLIGNKNEFFPDNDIKKSKNIEKLEQFAK